MKGPAPMNGGGSVLYTPLAELAAKVRARKVTSVSLVEESLSERSAARLGGATQVFGSYRSGRSDVGERHDAYLDEAFGG